MALIRSDLRVCPGGLEGLAGASFFGGQSFFYVKTGSFSRGKFRPAFELVVSGVQNDSVLRCILETRKLSLDPV